MIEVIDYFRYVGGEEPQVGDVLQVDCERDEALCLSYVPRGVSVTVKSVNAYRHVEVSSGGGWWPARFRLLRRKDEPTNTGQPWCIAYKCKNCGDAGTRDSRRPCTVCADELCWECCQAKHNGKLQWPPPAVERQPPCEHCHRLEFERTEGRGPLRCPTCQRIIKEELGVCQ